MRFELLDRVLEQTDDRIVAIKQVSAAEEYLQDHFPTYPVLPGVMMIEALAQAARRLLASRDAALGRHVLGEVRALRYVGFVRPGEVLRVEARLVGEGGEDGVFDFRGSGAILVVGDGDSEPRPAVGGRFRMRPLRIGLDSGESGGGALS